MKNFLLLLLPILVVGMLTFQACRKKDDPLISVSGVTLNKTSLTITVEGTEQLTATLAPIEAANKTVSWSSSDEAKVSVSKTGLVTANALGTATITVTTQDGNKTATCEVTVVAKTVSVSGISLDKTSTQVEVEGTAQLTPTFIPASATNTNIVCTSSQPTIVTVSSTGLITGVSIGSAIVTATTVDGNKVATCEVNVVAKPVRVTGVTLDKTSTQIHVDGTVQLTPTIAPALATNKNVTWASADDTKATVSSSGLVTGVAVGVVRISVTTADGSFVASCEVTIVQKPVAVTGIVLDKTSAQITVGGSVQINPTISPSNATNTNVNWASSDVTKATVSSSGLVTGVAVGVVTITATTQDGEKKATAEITIGAGSISVSSVSLEKTEAEIKVNEELTLQATILPANATNKNITWETSDGTKASVSSTGVVKGLAAGVTTITVKTEDGSKTATCKITVIPNTISVKSVSLNKTDETIRVNNELQLTATVLPGDATNKNVSWASSNTEIATVNATGLVKGIKAGTATITVTTDDGGKKATCNITVQGSGSNACDLLTFKLGEEQFVIKPIEGGTAHFYFAPYSIQSKRTEVPATYTLSEGATISPDPTKQDYTKAVTYTVTAEDGVTNKKYTVDIEPYDASTNQYGLYNARHLSDIRLATSASYKVMNNINIPAFGDSEVSTLGIPDYSPSGWKPIDNFSGDLDGNNKVIGDLYIDRITTDNVGLFSSTTSSSNIRNLSLTRATVTGRYNAGILAGTGGGTITDCLIIGRVWGETTLGALVGKNEGTITRCVARGGQVRTTNGTEPFKEGAGLVGENSSTGIIQQSWSSAEVAGPHFWAAGFVANNFGIIRECYSTGDVIGSHYTSGFVAANYGRIEDCYSTGNVNPDGFGYPDGDQFVSDKLPVSTIVRSFGLGTVPGINTEKYWVGQPTQASFPGYDFSTVWQWSNTRWPTLRRVATGTQPSIAFMIIQATGITLTGCPANSIVFSYKAGFDFQLSATVQPNTASQEVVWYVSGYQDAYRWVDQNVFKSSGRVTNTIATDDKWTLKERFYAHVNVRAVEGGYTYTAQCNFIIDP